MISIQQLFQNHQAGFTVYSPDCTQSRLWGNLDHAIQEATGFQVVCRQWINHDINSITRFYTSEDDPYQEEPDPDAAARKYDHIPAENLQYGHLVMKLFLSGPALLTVWHGPEAIETLSALKGATHPAQAGPHSMRGRFWCDNAVCNLIHVSDDYQEAELEIRAVHLEHVLEQEAAPIPLIEATAAPTAYAAHSGISVLCDVVNRMIAAMGAVHPLAVQLPPSGDAKETNHLLTAMLQETAQRLPESPTARFINAFCAGDVVTVTRMLKQMPVTKWEHFVIQCSAITREKWTTASEPI